MVLDGRLFHVIWSIKVRARHELSAGKMRFAWAIPNTNVFIAQAANTILSRGRPFGRFILRSRNHSGRERELHSYVDGDTRYLGSVGCWGMRCKNRLFGSMLVNSRDAYWNELVGVWKAHMHQYGENRIS